MNYPTLEEVNRADKKQLAIWYRFLPSPVNEDQVKIIDEIILSFHNKGGWTPELSKEVGWDDNFRDKETKSSWMIQPGGR